MNINDGWLTNEIVNAVLYNYSKYNKSITITTDYYQIGYKVCDSSPRLLWQIWYENSKKFAKTLQTAYEEWPIN